LLELLDGRHALTVQRTAERSPSLRVVAIDGGCQGGRAEPDPE
jgi:hypothetical protein